MASTSRLGLAIISINHPLCNHANLNALAQFTGCPRFSIDSVPEVNRHKFVTSDVECFIAMKRWIVAHLTSTKIIIDAGMSNLTRLEDAHTLLHARGFDVVFVWFSPKGTHLGHDSESFRKELEDYGRHLFPAKGFLKNLGGLLELEMSGSENDGDIVKRLTAHDMLRSRLPVKPIQVKKETLVLPSADLVPA